MTFLRVFPEGLHVWREVIGLILAIFYWSSANFPANTIPEGFFTELNLVYLFATREQKEREREAERQDRQRDRQRQMGNKYPPKSSI